MSKGIISALPSYLEAVEAAQAMAGQSFLVMAAPQGLSLERGLDAGQLRQRLGPFLQAEGREVWFRAFNLESEILWNRSFGLRAIVGKGGLEVSERYYELARPREESPGLARIWEIVVQWHGTGAAEPGGVRILGQDFRRDGRLVYIKLARISL